MRHLSLLAALFLAGCAATYPIPETGTAFELDRCPPFLNCVSSESSLFLYSVEPIHLTEPLNEASWAEVQSIIRDLPGASITESRFGYLRAVCYSDIIRFPDYFEVLVNEDRTQLGIRSQSQFGFYDLNVNRRRVERFKSELFEAGIAAQIE